MLVADIPWDDLEWLDAGSRGAVFVVGDYAVKVGLLYAEEFRLKQYALEKGVGMPVYDIAFDVEVPEDIIFAMEAARADRPNSWLWNWKGETHVMVMARATPILHTDADPGEVCDLVEEMFWRARDDAKLHWPDCIPANLGWWQKRLVILDW